MNVTESKEESLVEMCPMNEIVWKQEYQVERIAFAVTAIILNFLSFPACDNPDECAGDNGGKDKTQIAKQI